MMCIMNSAVLGLLLVSAPITVSIADTTRSCARVLRLAFDEASVVWRPYGVLLLNVTPDAHACLSVAVQDGPVAAVPKEASLVPLGAVRFGADGTPRREIRLSIGSTEALLRHPASPIASSDIPGVVHDQLLGRALGRVLAHEIGHFLLRFPAHVAAGLMAAQHTVDDLTNAARRSFQLNQLEPRLREALPLAFASCEALS
jgi:hypothetical protein